MKQDVGIPRQLHYSVTRCGIAGIGHHPTAALALDPQAHIGHHVFHWRSDDAKVVVLQHQCPYLLGNDVVQVYAVAGSLRHRFEDYANITLRYEDGRSAFVEANWLTPRKVRRLTITGTEGIIQVEYITQEVTVEQQTLSYTPLIENGEPLRRELDSFVTAIHEDIPPTPSGLDGLKALHICDAALQSARRHQPVNLVS